MREALLPSPHETFAVCGRALFGEQFRAPLADALGVTLPVVKKWSTGKSRIPPGVWGDMDKLMSDRKEVLRIAHGRAWDLIAAISTAPADAAHAPGFPAR